MILNKLLIAGLTSLLLLTYYPTTTAERPNVNGGAPTLTITVTRINGIDPIDVLDPPEWYFYIGVFNESNQSASWQRSPLPVAYNQNDVTLNKTYAFAFNIGATTISFSIYLCEYDEGWSPDDLADISSDQYQGMDDVICTPPSQGYYRGGYYGTYDIVSNKLISGDRVEVVGGSYKTSGEFDNVSGDNNDAELYFTIMDNYEPPTAVAVCNPTNLYVGDKVTCDASGSHASQVSRIVKYHWDFGDQNTGDGLTTSHSYSMKGGFKVRLFVTDDFQQVASDQVSITVNSKPGGGGTGSGNPGVASSSSMLLWILLLVIAIVLFLVILVLWSRKRKALLEKAYMPAEPSTPPLSDLTAYQYQEHEPLASTSYYLPDPIADVTEVHAEQQSEPKTSIVFRCERCGGAYVEGGECPYCK